MSNNNPLQPNKYRGTDKYITYTVTRNRRPTLADYRQPETGNYYSLCTTWQVGKNPTTGVEGEIWGLSKIIANQGYWVMLSGGGVGPLLNIDVPNGTSPVVPDGSGTLAFTSSDSSVTITGGTNTIDFKTNSSLTVEGLIPDAHTAPGTSPIVPSGGNITVTGAQVATGTIGANVIRTDSLAANTMTIEIQRTTAVAAADSTKNGVSHFDSGAFAVAATGFVTLAGGGIANTNVNVDAHTAPGTDPVVPNASGQITVTGAQVAAGTVGANVIRTDSLAANTYTIEVQRSAAVGATASVNNGVSHFNSANFTVDANGFVSLSKAFSVVTQVFTSNGTYTPTSGMVYCIVEVVGGGGGGGGAASTSAVQVGTGSGAGAGGYARKTFNAATIGASKAVTVGTGGAGGSSTSATTGGTGNTTSVGVLISATGGIGGTCSNVSGGAIDVNGGAGGTGSGGDFNTSGNAGNGGIGTFNATSAATLSGFGGSSFFGGGGMSMGAQFTSVAGSNATSYGGGGGGASSGISGAGASGGNGADGVVIVTEYVLS